MAKGLPRSGNRAAVSPSGGQRADRGTPSGSGVSLSELTFGAEVRKLKLSLVNVHVPLVDEAGVVAYGGLKVFDFPEGLVLFLGATADLALTKSATGVIAAFDGDVGLGTVTASNNTTLSSTEQNLIPTTSTPQAVSGVTTADCKSTSTEGAKILDGTATAVDMFLNLLVDDADHDVTGTPTDLIVNGTITFAYMMLGDI